MNTFAHTCLIPAAPSAVYAAFTAPERLARWWGPEGFRNTFTLCDFRPGGAWRFTMHGPDGKDYPNESQFVEVVPNARVVIRHVNAPHFVLTVELRAEGEGTRGKGSATSVTAMSSSSNIDRIARRVGSARAAKMGLIGSVMRHPWLTRPSSSTDRLNILHGGVTAKMGQEGCKEFHKPLFCKDLNRIIWLDSVPPPA